MSDINYSVAMRIAKGNLSNQVNVSGVTASMTVGGMKSQSLDLNATPVSIDTTGIATLGLAFVQNISTHTAATVAMSANGATFCTARYGEPSLLRLVPGQTYTAHGTVGSRIRIDITEG
jgi:hypothetical protein